MLQIFVATCLFVLCTCSVLGNSVHAKEEALKNKEALSEEETPDVIDRAAEREITKVRKQAIAVQRAISKYTLLLGSSYKEPYCYPPLHWQNPDPNYHYDSKYSLAVHQADLKADIGILQKKYCVYCYLSHKKIYWDLKPLVLNNGLSSSLKIAALSKAEFEQLLKEGAFDYTIEMFELNAAMLAVQEEMDKYKAVAAEYPLPLRANASLEDLRTYFEGLKVILWGRYSDYWLRTFQGTSQAPSLELTTKYGTKIEVTKPKPAV